jgi:carbon-monoxide dehydrogenase iron sulfur subunit
VIRVDISKCTGCKKCESVCAFFRTGRVNHHLSRMKVLNIYELGIDGPVVCIQCKERFCDCCPENAISMGSLGQVIVSPTLCTLCGACETVCPIGAIEIFNDIVYVCDLCGGRPKCVKACTEGAIQYVTETSTHASLVDFAKKTRKMNPDQKRYFYLKNLGLEVRKKWRKEYA